MILKIVNQQEKLNIIRRLQSLLKVFHKQGNSEMWWHSLRMCYSLKNELVPQTVYVDKYPECDFIISKYTNKNSGKNLEVFTSSSKDTSIIRKACEAAVEMIATEDMSYGQIQSSPYFLFSSLTESIKKHKLNIVEDIGANCMTFPFENIDKLVKSTRPIDGFICKPLRESDAELVNNRFKYAKHPDTYKWIKKSIQTLPSMGCWNSKGELVGQFITMESGNVGGLFVIDEYKGLKLGKWIVQETVKLFHSRNVPMILETEFSNRISYNLFTGLGFETKAFSYYMLLSRDSEIKDPI